MSKTNARAESAPVDTNIHTVPLNLLRVSKINVRKPVKGGLSIPQLAASIDAQGLIQNLVVYEDEQRGKTVYAVAAGGRRLAALQLLAKTGRLAKDADILCRVIPKAKAVETSLTENVQREAMHPADEYEAFKTLADEGLSVEEIGDHFGLDLIHVRRRLALGEVSPKVLAAYRQGKMTLDAVMAMTMTSDHARQERLMKENPHAWAIRQALTVDEVPETDPKVRFVGLDAYHEAGGVSLPYLFTDDDQPRARIVDVALLEKLASEKLEAAAEALADEGAWVECRVSFNRYGEGYELVPTERRDYTPDEAQLVAELNAELEQIEAALEAIDEDSPDADEQNDKLNEQWDAVQERIADIDDACSQPVAAAADVAGTVVTIAHNGALEVFRNLLRPEDAGKLKGIKKAVSEGGGGKNEAKKDGDPLRLVRDLSALQTAVVQSAAIANPAVTLRLLAARLLDQALNFHTNVPAGVRVDQCSPGEFLEADANPAAEPMAAAFETWKAWAGADGDSILQKCLEASDADVQAIIAFTVARSIDGIRRFPGNGPMLDALVSAYGVDMRDHWTPNAEYFAAIRKSDTLAAIEAVKPEADAKALGKMKRPELANAAAEQLAGTGWLPPTLRPAVAE